MSADVAARVEAILAAHEVSYQSDGDFGEYQWVECSCGSEYFVDTPATEVEYRAHVAAAIAADLADVAGDGLLAEVRRRVMGPSDDFRDAATCRSIANEIDDLRAALAAQPAPADDEGGAR